MTEYLFFADYGSGPLWVATDCGIIAMKTDSVGLSDGLVAAIADWSKTYDDLHATDYEFTSAEARRAWLAQGEELLVLIRRELGPRYRVVSHLESTA